MKTGIFFTARLGSSRLKQKHLLPVNGRPILHYLLKRVERAFQPELAAERASLVIVTSDEPENRQFEQFTNSNTGVFYGSINNIPLRHFQAAEHHSVDQIVAVDGDDILCSFAGMRAALDALLSGADYVKTSNLPFGMNCLGYRRKFLESSLEGHGDSILETGWGRIFDQNLQRDIPMPFSIQNESLRFTLDYEEDYNFLRKVIESFHDGIFDAADEDIVQAVIKRNLYSINEGISKQYWENFYKSQQREAMSSSRRSS